MKLPLYRQVYEELRKDIMDGIYLPGDYLPSIREEAKRLGVARNTVENAYLMLAEEGYVQPRRGQGSQVVDIWRSFYYREDSSTGDSCNTDLCPASLSGTGDSGGRSGHPRCTAEAEAFRLNLRENGSFRRKQMRKAVLFDFRSGIASPCMLPRGFGRLLEDRLMLKCREYGMAPAIDRVCTQIRRYLKKHRGVTCTEEQIFLCRNLQQALRLVRQTQAHVLYTVPHHAGHNSNHLHIEEIDGLYRRMEKVGLYLLEDDLDGEMVYERRLYPTLFEKETEGRVILTAGLDRFFAPALGLQYVVFPSQMLKKRTGIFSTIRRDGRHSLLELETIDLVMSSDGWENRFRKQYYQNLQKRNVLIECLRRAFTDSVILHRTEAGTEIVAVIPCEKKAHSVMEKLSEEGLDMDIRSGWYRDSRHLYMRIRYESISIEKIEAGIKTLAGILKSGA